MKNITEKYIQQILEEILLHEGIDNPIQVSELMEIVPLTDREVRKVIQYLVNERLQPIGSKSSLPAGFFKITDIDDFIEALSNLNPRSKKIEDRALNLAKACRNNGIDIPEVHISKYKNNSKISVHIHNSVVFIGNEKDVVK
ncbi:hypothetical protein H6762_03185 [Candidatus Nomurabacteria bacterium]|nr:hypothetical protein [Candidatus Nomurabacteria bacterium]